MRRSQELARIEGTATDRVRRLRLQWPLATAAASQSDRVRWMTCLTLTLQNVWANFCRAHYLSCMMGTWTRSRTKAAATPVVAIEFQAIERAIVAAKGGSSFPTPASPGAWAHYQEPKWFDPTTVARIYEKTGISLLATFQEATGSRSDVLQDIRAFRNYFAHRALATRQAAMQKAARVGIFAPTLPADAISERPLGETRAWFEVWLDEMDELIVDLCR